MGPPQDLDLTEVGPPQDLYLTEVGPPQDLDLKEVGPPQDLDLTEVGPQDLYLTEVGPPQDLDLAEQHSIGQRCISSKFHGYSNPRCLGPMDRRLYTRWIVIALQSAGLNTVKIFVLIRVFYINFVT